MIPGIMAMQARPVSAGAVLWTPLNMAVVPQIYLDAQGSVVTDVSGFASAISNLGAMGSDGDFSQATAGNRPAILAAELNGKRVLSFADDFLSNGSTAAREVFRNVAAAWVFVVYKKRTLDGSATTRYLIYGPESTGGVRFGAQCGSFAGGANRPNMVVRRQDADSASNLTSPNVRQGSYVMLLSSMNFSSRAGLMRENGAQSAANATLTPAAGNTSNTATASAPLTIGGTGIDFPSDIDLACIVVGNTQPSLAEFEKLEGWAAHDRGLAANLPAGHPYKTLPPTV